MVRSRLVIRAPRVGDRLTRAQGSCRSRLAVEIQRAEGEAVLLLVVA